MSNTADLLVIGGGSAGLATAIRAARHGAKVTLFEPYELGGTCVNRGCVPKKAMWFAAELAEAQQFAKAVGFRVTPGPLDWPAFVVHREAYVARARAAYTKRLQELGIERVAEFAHFLDAHTLEAGGREYRAPHVLIATGSRPRALGVPGENLLIDSDGFFRLQARPSHVALVGGGYIAVELAGVLQALGAQVEILSRRGLLSRFDADLGAALSSLMEASGIVQHRGVELGAVRRNADGLHLETTAGNSYGPYDCVIAAIGRVPNTENLHLDAAGVKLDAAQAIVTDEFENTSAAGVYALGDINGKLLLTPVAIAAGRQLAERLFGGQPEAHLDYSCVPSVVFSHPPVGSVGFTEAEARARYGAAVTVHHTRFTPMLWALAGHAGQTCMKLVCTGEEQRVVGLHGIGPGMDEMLQGFAVAVRMDARYADLLSTVAIHPTSAEEFVTMN
ncbi:MAG: glutathione-disulfide reductase [Gammaproteobacteria bacterium]